MSASGAAIRAVAPAIIPPGLLPGAVTITFDLRVVTFSVQQRVREFSLRMALGATAVNVLRHVAGHAVRLIATGALIGLALAAVSSRLLASMLFGVEPLDPLTFVVVTVVLGLTAALSVAAPAWRATRVDPAVTLRSE